MSFADVTISTSELHFGFKIVTNHCTGLLKYVISRYMNAKSNVLACFVDASKAF